MALGTIYSSTLANTEGVFVKDWTWKASDTQAGQLVENQVLLRACWDIPSTLQIPGNQSVEYWKSKVEQHITDTWNLYAGIRIVFGTSQCDVKIGHKDLRYKPGTTIDWNPNSQIGSNAKGLLPEPAMWLCWTFKNYQPGIVGRISGKVLQYDADFHEKAILSQAEHEFGHLLGLIHDQNSPDKPSTCTAKLDQINKKYDPLSFYCYVPRCSSVNVGGNPTFQSHSHV